MSRAAQGGSDNTVDEADDGHHLGEPIQPTEPSSNDDAIGTPAAAIETKAVPDDVDLSVEALGENMVGVRLSSSTISGKVFVEPGPARQLAADLLEAADEAESGE